MHTYDMKEGNFFGLLPIVQKQYVVNWDMLLFTYLATSRFDLIILDHSRTENMLPIDVVVIGNF